MKRQGNLSVLAIISMKYTVSPLFYLIVFLNRPVSVLENLNAFTVFRDADDVHIFTSEHKVHMYHRTVYARFFALLDCHILEAFQTFVETSSERHVTACVLIEKRIIKQYSSIVYGGNRKL